MKSFTPTVAGLQAPDQCQCHNARTVTAQIRKLSTKRGISERSKTQTVTQNKRHDQKVPRQTLISATGHNLFLWICFFFTFENKTSVYELFDSLLPSRAEQDDQVWRLFLRNILTWQSGSNYPRGQQGNLTWICRCISRCCQFDAGVQCFNNQHKAGKPLIWSRTCCSQTCTYCTAIVERPTVTTTNQTRSQTTAEAE